jgi:tetratricopeptide (TPR) repeat protein
MYDNIANPKDANGNELEKPADADDKIKQAEADYKKAVELKPNYFDALFDLGVLYFNHGVAITKLADKITDAAKSKAEDIKATAEFNKAMIPLEKALEIDPKNNNTMYALSKIYARLALTDKYNAIKERMK